MNWHYPKPKFDVGPVRIGNGTNYGPKVSRHHPKFWKQMRYGCTLFPFDGQEQPQQGPVLRRWYRHSCESARFPGLLCLDPAVLFYLVSPRELAYLHKHELPRRTDSYMCYYPYSHKTRVLLNRIIERKYKQQELRRYSNKTRELIKFYGLPR